MIPPGSAGTRQRWSASLTSVHPRVTARRDPRPRRRRATRRGSCRDHRRLLAGFDTGRTGRPGEAHPPRPRDVAAHGRHVRRRSRRQAVPELHGGDRQRRRRARSSSTPSAATSAGAGGCRNASASATRPRARSSPRARWSSAGTATTTGTSSSARRTGSRARARTRCYDATRRSGYCFFDQVRLSRPAGRRPRDPDVRQGHVQRPQDARARDGPLPGWTDPYYWTLPDQRLLVTGLADGVYRLWADADPGNWFRETNETNNRTWIDVRLTLSTRPPPTVDASSAWRAAGAPSDWRSP